MKFPPASAGKFFRRRLVGLIVGLTALSVAASGTAYADRAGDAGPNGNQSRRQADRPSGNAARPEKKPGGDFAGFDVSKAQSTIRDDAENVALSERKIAAAVRDELERMGFDVISPAAQQAAFSGGAVPTVGIGGLVPNARALAAYIISTYPGVQSIGGVRSDPLPDHPSGHAIDIMIGSDMGLGDAINADVEGKAARFGVSYTLWRVADHFNHVHVTVF